MIYNHDGVKFQGKELKIFHSKIEQVHSTQRYVSYFHVGARFGVRRGWA